jgi:mRNA interferase RelE/StbE
MYALEIQQKALKQIASLPKKDARKIFSAMEVLKENPLAGKQLQGEHKGLRSLRVWPYRILYAIDHRIITVTVVKVGHRKDIYA